MQNPAMKELAEIHAQYQSGILTLPEFLLASHHAMQEEGVIEELTRARDLMKYKDVMEWEKANGFQPA